MLKKNPFTMQIFTNVRRIALFVLSMVLSMGVLIAQERTITGKVTAEGEGALPGVNIIVQGTTLGVMTDADGNYSITVPGPTSVLVVSSIGYLTQAITVGSRTVIDIVLVSDVQALQEVVVTGYTSQRRRDITGAVSTVTTDELTAIPVQNVQTQLQGRTSGVNVIGNGQPGDEARVRIRGFASFQNNAPLYIVDGIPTGGVGDLNPNDIESLTVLKDAGSASVYGARASNGVIVITTKKGAKGTKVTYDMYYGTQFPGKGPTDLLTTQEYADLQWLVYRNDDVHEIHPFYGDSDNPTPTLPSWAGNSNWYDAITDPAPMMSHDITLSGGTDNSRFFAGFGYYSQDGIVIYGYSKRYTARFNSEFTFLNNRVKVGENFNMAYGDSHTYANQQEGSPIQMGVYRTQPIIPIVWTGPDFPGQLSTHLWTAGDWGGTGIAPRLGNGSNEVADLTRGKDNKGWSINLIGNTYVDIKLLEGLNFRSTIGGTFYTGYYANYNMATYESAENNYTPSLNEGAYYGNDWVWTNQLTFDRTFGQHRVQAVAGYEAVKSGVGRSVSGTRAGYYSDAISFRTLNNGKQITGASSSLNTPRTLLSMFAKVDYGFMDKYLISATIRRDGASVFGPSTRYGIFPAVSAAWRISSESFMSGLSWLSDLKLRGTYGTMGNQQAVSTGNQFYLYGSGAARANYDLTGTMTSSLQGFSPSRIGNVNAKWETNITTNVGIDAGFLNNKITVVLDLYQKETKDLLYTQDLVATVGAASRPAVNIASMMNKGIDASVGYKNSWGDFGLNVTGTFTAYKNEITKLTEGIDYFDNSVGTRISGGARNMVGHPVSAFFGYQVIGLFQTDAEVASAPVQDGAQPGVFRYLNSDAATDTTAGGRGTITPADRVFIGDPNPAFTYGLNLTLSYKGFDLTAYGYGSYGNDIFNWNKWWVDFWPSFQGQKSKELLYESWTSTRTNTIVPIATQASNFSTNNEVNSYYIEDGSYFRLKNLQLGYTLPTSIVSKVNIKSLRIYVQTVNLFTLTKYSGLDPEIGGNDTMFGSDRGNYPTVRQLIFGLNLVL